MGIGPCLRFICRDSDLRAILKICLPYFRFICQKCDISATIQNTTNFAELSGLIITKKYKHIDTLNLKIFVIFERIRSEIKSLI